MRPEAGFSLVEALVALAVFAMAGVGLAQLQSHSLATLTAVETRTLAGLVADEALVEAVSAIAPPAIGVRETETEMAGRRWRVRVETAATADPALFRISVATFAQDARLPAAESHAFRAAPAAVFAP